MYANTPELNITFRVSPILAVLILIATPFFGTPFLQIGLIFGIGLLGVCALLGLPKASDFVFGLVIIMFVFAVQFLGSIFLGLELGGDQKWVVGTTAGIWFTQLFAVVIDLKLFTSVSPAHPAAETEGSKPGN